MTVQPSAEGFIRTLKVWIAMDALSRKKADPLSSQLLLVVVSETVTAEPGKEGSRGFELPDRLARALGTIIPAQRTSGSGHKKWNLGTLTLAAISVTGGRTRERLTDDDICQRP